MRRRTLDIIVSSGVLDDRVWVADTRRDAVVSFDPTTLRSAGGRTVTGPRPFAVATGDGELWVSHLGDGSVVRVTDDG